MVGEVQMQWMTEYSMQRELECGFFLKGREGRERQAERRGRERESEVEGKRQRPTCLIRKREGERQKQTLEWAELVP